MKQSHLDLLIFFLAECIGTGLLVFIGCMGAVETTHGAPPHISIALGFGLAVMLIINIFGMVTGAHLNPVVTLGAYIYKLVSIPVSLSDDALRGRVINCCFRLFIAGMRRLRSWANARRLFRLRTSSSDFRGQS